MHAIRSIVIGILCVLSTHVFSQEDPTVHTVDDIQIDVKAVKADAKSDTLSVDLFLISYKKGPREFKLNTYGTQVVDEKGEKHFFTNMKMGQVFVQLVDRQNYLHYLLSEEMPVPLNVKIVGWGKQKAKKILLVFEDSAEEGKFIETEIAL